jgi:2-polyprenyl-3-methyl-5-hydroxy-6-metoxy-1,4-benzoquinol methylase
MLRLKRLVGQLLPISMIDWQEQELLYIQQNEQEWIEFCTLLPSHYQITLLKRLVELIDLEDTMVHISTLFTSPTIHNGYKVFFMPLGNEMLLLRENREWISHGTTGLSTWGASLYLIEYFSLNPMAGKRILELGAGLGLLSMALKLMGNEICATDCAVVIDRLAESVQLNKMDITVSFLNWHSPDLLWDGDVIVCADVVFDPSLIEPLLHTISKYIKNKVCYLACTKRNQETWDRLESMLVSLFLVETDEMSPSWFVYQESSPIYLFILRELV